MRIRQMVFMAGGVLLPTLTQATLAVLDLTQQPPARSQLLLYGLERAVATGRLTLEEYARRVIERTGSAISCSDLLAAVAETTALRTGVLSLLGDLSQRLELGLVSDYPAQWVRPIIERSGLPVYFPNGPTAYVADLQTNHDYRSMFSQLVALNVLRPGSSMWVDGHPLRCMAAIRQRIDAGIFVDTNRFYRDLGLWGLLPFDFSPTG